MTEKRDASFKAYLKAIGHGIAQIKYIKVKYTKLSNYDKQTLRLLGFLGSLVITMLAPYIFLNLLHGRPVEGNDVWVVAAIWWFSWFCLFYLPWREKQRDCR